VAWTPGGAASAVDLVALQRGQLALEHLGVVAGSVRRVIAARVAHTPSGVESVTMGA